MIDNLSNFIKRHFSKSFLIMLFCIILIFILTFFAFSKIQKSLSTISKSPLKNIHFPNIKETALKVKKGDTLEKIITRAGFPEKEYLNLINSSTVKTHLANLKIGNQFAIYSLPNKKIAKVVYQKDFNHNLIANKSNGKFSIKTITKPVLEKTAYYNFTINSSLIEDAKKSGVPTNTIYQLIKIFENKINFAREIKSSDTVKIMVEKTYVDGKCVATGDIVAAKIITKKKTYEAFRYKSNNKNYSYFNSQGKSLALAFIRFPVKFTHISSPFAEKRWHPILHIYRRHDGIDLAAPTGTPVKSSGNGYVTFFGNIKGYGKTIKIKHNKIYSSLYAHLSRFANNLRKGLRVTKGEIIGYVGETGLATGPHLHYEFHINGVPKDPAKVKLPPVNYISKSMLKNYFSYVNKINLIFEKRSKAT